MSENEDCILVGVLQQEGADIQKDSLQLSTQDLSEKLSKSFFADKIYKAADIETTLAESKLEKFGWTQIYNVTRELIRKSS